MRKLNVAETRVNGRVAQHNQANPRWAQIAHHLLKIMDVFNQETFLSAAKNQANLKRNN